LLSKGGGVQSWFRCRYDVHAREERRECKPRKMLDSERSGMKFEVVPIEQTAQGFEYQLNPQAVDEVMKVVSSLIC
jgi:hypothetical protein